MTMNHMLSTVPALDVCLAHCLTLGIGCVFLSVRPSNRPQNLSVIQESCLFTRTPLSPSFLPNTKKQTRQVHGVTTLLCRSSAPPGVNPDPSPAHCANWPPTRHRRIRKGLKVSEGFQQAKLIPCFFFFFSCLSLLSLSTCFPLSVCSFLAPILSSVPVSLLVIYSGQSVPLHSPSRREDEGEWSCFLMYFSAMCEKDGQK